MPEVVRISSNMYVFVYGQMDKYIYILVIAVTTINSIELTTSNNFDTRFIKIINKSKVKAKDELKYFFPKIVNAGARIRNKNYPPPLILKKKIRRGGVIGAPSAKQGIAPNKLLILKKSIKCSLLFHKSW